MTWATIAPVLIAVALPAYVLWRKYSAMRARGVLADEVNEYLGNDEHPEELKLLVYRAFDDCQEHTLPLEIIYFFLFKSRASSAKTVHILTERFGEDAVTNSINITLRLILVNVRLSPGLYLLLGSVFVGASVCRTVADSASLSLNPLKSLRLRLERSVLAAVH